MFTRRDAEAGGWVFDLGEGRGRATRYPLADDAADTSPEPLARIDTDSATPLFSLLVNIAEREGAGFVAGYGGNSPVTPELVLSTSGETYAERAPSPPSPEMLDAAAEQLRAIRNDWLNQAQPIFTEIISPGAQDLSTAMLEGIEANADAWIEWRQRMRDLPAGDIDWLGVAASGLPIVSTTEDWPQPWPSPPTAPVVRRRILS